MNAVTWTHHHFIILLCLLVMNATMNSQTMTASCIYFEKAFVGFLDDDDDDDDDLAQKNVCGLCSSK